MRRPPPATLATPAARRPGDRCAPPALRILHVGPEDRGTSSQRVRAMRDLGHEVERVFYSTFGEQPCFGRRAYRSLRRRLGYPVERRGENASLIAAAARLRPDLVFVEKGLALRPKTLRRLRAADPACALAAYSVDDMMNPGNSSRYYLRCLALYDVHFTTKRFNVAELLALGAGRVEHVGNAYCPHIHRPVQLSAEDRSAYGSDVAFVGGYEPPRARILNRIAQSGIPVRIWGNNWHKFKSPDQNLRIEYRPAYEDEYAKVVSASRIHLGFLRKVNRDTETTRTLEIPACRGFLLAERTADQQALFCEGTEAEYFSSEAELLDKLRHYLAHEAQRSAIAEAGYRRCLASEYSYEARMARILAVCEEIRQKRGQAR